MRAPGDQQGFFADRKPARHRGAEIRDGSGGVQKKKSAARRRSVRCGPWVGDIRAEEALDKAIALSGYKKPKPRNVGRGLALAEWCSSGGEGTVFLKIDERGKIIGSSPVLDQGAGVFTVICEVVGEELNVPAQSVELEQLDSRSVQSDTDVGGAGPPRYTAMPPKTAATGARQALLKIAAEQMGAHVGDLELADGFVIGRTTKRRMSFAELVKANRVPIQIKGYWKKDANPRDNSIAAQIAEVHVDPETGEVTLRSFVSVYTTGKVINPLMHRGQIDGGLVCGLGLR